jgi:hypothetical protein
LFEELAKLCHSIAPRVNAEDIVYETFNKLLGDIFTVEISLREVSGFQKLAKRYSLGRERDWLGR